MIIKEEKLISVVMSVYNEKLEFLRKSIDSILLQTYKNIQFIIVIDDPNNNDICELLEEYASKNKRIKIIVNEKNMGLTASLNEALKYCDGEYIARMDSDDISMPNRLYKQLEYLKLYNLDIVGCETRRITEKEEIVIEKTNISYSPECIMKCLRYGNCVAHPSWFLKKDIYTKLNGYRDMPACEDYDFLLRALNYGCRIGICDDILLNYRINTNGISRKNILKQKLVADYISNSLNRINEITIEEARKKIEKKSVKKAQEKYSKSMQYFTQACYYNNKSIIKSIKFMLKALFSSKYMFSKLYRMIMLKIIRKNYK